MARGQGQPGDESRQPGGTAAAPGNPGPTVAGWTLERLRLPLSSPYHLSFGDVLAYDTVLARVRTSDGIEGWGESTPLPGYSHEDADSVWERNISWCRRLKGRSTGDALASLARRAREAPFACAAPATAIEDAEERGRPGVPVGCARPGVPVGCARPVRLVGTIRSASPADIAGEVPVLLAAGYTTLKLKVGAGVDADLARVRAAQDALAGRGRLRLDANQGYAPDGARRFLARLDPAGIELFEQPFPADRWDWTAELGQGAPVPLMLDESVAGGPDVDRAARTPGVRFVKFKLMKAGSAARFRRLIDRARALGLGVVVGNGVAADLGCLHEARAAVGRTELAAEMNGFLKPVASLLERPLQVVDGCLALPAACRIRPEAVARFRVASVDL